MDSSIVISSSFLPFHKSKPNFLFPITPFSKTPQKPSSKISITANYSSNYTINPSNKETPFAKTLQIAGKTLIFTVATTLIASKFNEFPPKAEPLTPTVEKSTVEEDKVENFNKIESGVKEEFTLSQLVKSHSELVENLWSQLQKKLEIRDDEEALKIVDKLVEAQPSEMELKYLRARLLREMGKIQEASKAFIEILELSPGCVEALFESGLILDRLAQNEMIQRFAYAFTDLSERRKLEMHAKNLWEMLTSFDWDGYEDEIEDYTNDYSNYVFLGIRGDEFANAQSSFLDNRVYEALSRYDGLIKKDPKDCKPYFCKGMIYSLLEQHAEAKEMFAKYCELSPKRKYNVDGYFTAPIPSIKVSVTDY